MPSFTGYKNTQVGLEQRNTIPAGTPSAVQCTWVQKIRNFQPISRYLGNDTRKACGYCGTLIRSDLYTYARMLDQQQSQIRHGNPHADGRVGKWSDTPVLRDGPPRASISGCRLLVRTAFVVERPFQHDNTYGGVALEVSDDPIPRARPRHIAETV